MADFSTVLRPTNTTLTTYNKESKSQKLTVVDSGNNKFYTLPTTFPFIQNVPLSLQSDNNNNLSFVSSYLFNPSYCSTQGTLLSIPPDTTPLTPIGRFSSTSDFQINSNSFICRTSGIYFVSITGNFQVLVNGNANQISFLQNAALSIPGIQIGFGGYNTFDVQKPISLSGIITVVANDEFTIRISNSGPGDINMNAVILSFFRIA